MIIDYIHAALAHAKYDILSDSQQFYGEIPDFLGVYASADTLEDCRRQLEEVLEGWILVRVSRHLPLPQINGLELAIREVA